LDEAMALHRKEEAVGQELGDRASLAISLADQAEIHKLQNQPELRREKLEKARALFAAIGMAPELATVDAWLRNP
jgi:hypothetical protein